MLRRPMLFLWFDHPLIEAWLEARLRAAVGDDPTPTSHSPDYIRAHGVLEWSYCTRRP